MSNASNPLKWAFVLLGIALLATAVGIGAFYSNPVGIGMTLARQALDRMGLERQAFDAPAGRLLYWRGGAGEPVVLVHGMGNQAGTWVKIAADLSHSARLLVPDLPGHGDSAPYEGSLTLQDEVAGLAALIDRESPDTPVTLVGNSMGGWVSLLYAAEHPDRVKRVIALNSAGLEYDLGDLTLVPSTREEARALVTAMSPEGVGLPRDFVIDDLIEKITDGAGPRLIAGHDPADFLDRHADRITVPVEVVWGVEDRLLPVAQGERLVAMLPNARMHRLERCAHIPQQQCPWKTLELIRGLLGESPASTGPNVLAPTVLAPGEMSEPPAEVAAPSPTP